MRGVRKAPFLLTRDMVLALTPAKSAPALRWRWVLVAGLTSCIPHSHCPRGCVRAQTLESTFPLDQCAALFHCLYGGAPHQ